MEYKAEQKGEVGNGYGISFNEARQGAKSEVEKTDF